MSTMLCRCLEQTKNWSAERQKRKSLQQPVFPVGHSSKIDRSQPWSDENGCIQGDMAVDKECAVVGKTWLHYINIRLTVYRKPSFGESTCIFACSRFWFGKESEMRSWLILPNSWNMNLRSLIMRIDRAWKKSSSLAWRKGTKKTPMI